MKRYTGTGICSVCATTNTQKIQALKREPLERTAAREAGELRYNSGFSCKNEHEPERYVSDGACCECRAGFQRKYSKAKPEVYAARARQNRARNPQPHREGAKKWYWGNRERAWANLAIWRANNPDKVKMNARIGTERRRTRLLDNGGYFTSADVKKMYVRQNGACAVCPSTSDLEIDHILPVILGGSSDPSNLQLLCQPCNRSKGAMHPDEWRRSLKSKQLQYW